MKSIRFVLCFAAILFTLTIQSATAQTAHSSGGTFGSVNVGAAAATPVTVTFTFDTGGTLGSTLVVTQGVKGLDYTDAGTGTCKDNTTYSKGDTCTVDVAFKPLHPGPRYGAAELLDGSGNLAGLGYVQGTGIGPQAVFADTTTGVYLPSKQTTLSSVFGWPIGVAVDASGDVFVADTQHWAVKEIVAVNGSIPASPTIKTLGSSIIYPWRAVVDGAGNVFVGNDMTSQRDCCGSVYEIVAAGGYTTMKTLHSGFKGPANVAVDGSGNVFVGECAGDGGVNEMVAAGGYTTVKTLGSGFNSPCDVAVDGSDNVFVADAGNHAVKEIVAAGGYTTVKTLGSGLQPGGLAVDASGNVFFASGPAVNEILAAGGYASILTLGSGFSSASDVAVDGSGNVFVSDYNNDAAIELDFADPPSLTYTATAAGVESSDSPQTVTVSNDGNADLAFPVPADGDNPVLSGDGFTLDSATTCPQLNSGSAVGTLAAGASCAYAVDFTPPLLDSFSGSLALTEDSLNASPAATVTVPLAGTLRAPHLAFTTPPPATLTTGQNPGTVAVSVEDANNEVVTSSSATVTLTVTGPNSYSKVYTATASGGIAAFSSLASLSAVGTYAYKATDTPDGLIEAIATESVVAPNLAFTTPPPSSLATGQNPGTVAVSVEDGNNKVVTTSSATVTLAVTGPGSYSKVYTATASSGVATFASLASLGAVGTYTYTATDTPDGLTQAVATESVVAPHLAFTTAPLASLQAGQSPGTVAVSVEDASNNVVTTSSATVTLTVTGPKSYSKTYTATASSGVATFASLPSISRIGSYSYTATDTPDGISQAVASESVWTPPPVGKAEAVRDAATLSATIAQADKLAVSGWAADPSLGAPLSSVQILIDGNAVGNATVDLARPDVAARQNNSAYLLSGWTFTYPATGLSVGTHTVQAVAYDSYGASAPLTAMGTVSNSILSFTVAATQAWGPPLGFIDGITDAATNSAIVAQADNLLVSGWAVDAHDNAPVSQVQVLIDGNPAGNATLNIARPDVARNQNNNAWLHSGWSFTYAASGLSVGNHTASAVVTDSLGSSTTLRSKSFTVATTQSFGPPFGAVDQAVDATTLSTTVSQADNLLVSGWAADAHDGSPVSQVQILIDGTSVGNATLGLKRPDVAQKRGSAYLNSGWTFTYSASGLSLGDHTIEAVATDSLSNSTTLAYRAITVTQ